MSTVLTNSKSIKEFLSIANKTEEELRTICKTIGVEVEGSQDEIVATLLKSSVVSGTLKPQAIPLSTRGSSSLQASNSMREWRKKIFQYNKEAEFDMVSAKGSTYRIKAHYIPCTHEEAQTFLSNGWYLDTPQQEQLIKEAKNNPSKFDFNVIRKLDNKGNQWLMLHMKTIG